MFEKHKALNISFSKEILTNVKKYIKAITQNWLNYAEIDLQLRKKLLEDEFVSSTVAFHA